MDSLQEDSGTTNKVESRFWLDCHHTKQDFLRMRCEVACIRHEQPKALFECVTVTCYAIIADGRLRGHAGLFERVVSHVVSRRRVGVINPYPVVATAVSKISSAYLHWELHALNSPNHTYPLRFPPWVQELLAIIDRIEDFFPDLIRLQGRWKNVDKHQYQCSCGSQETDCDVSKEIACKFIDLFICMTTGCILMMLVYCLFRSSLRSNFLKK